jgi:hypothetical protein
MSDGTALLITLVLLGFLGVFATIARVRHIRAETKRGAEFWRTYEAQARAFYRKHYPQWLAEGGVAGDDDSFLAWIRERVSDNSDSYRGALNPLDAHYSWEFLMCLRDEVKRNKFLDDGFSTEGTEATPYESDARYLTENARRIRFIQRGPGAVAAKNLVKDSRIPLVAVWKEGIDGKGGPSDIMLTRMVAPHCSLPGDANYDPMMNPYAAERNFVCSHYSSLDPDTCLEGRVQNMSAQSVLATEGTGGDNDDVDGSVAESEEEPAEESVPTDMCFARTVDYASTYEYEAFRTEEDNPAGPEVVWAWEALAKDFQGQYVVEEGEAQLSVIPAGNAFWAVWLADTTDELKGDGNE